jgi:hypothetical protein
MAGARIKRLAEFFGDLVGSDQVLQPPRCRKSDEPSVPRRPPLRCAARGSDWESHARSSRPALPGRAPAPEKSLAARGAPGRDRTDRLCPPLRTLVSDTLHEIRAAGTLETERRSPNRWSSDRTGVATWQPFTTREFVLGHRGHFRASMKPRQSKHRFPILRIARRMPSVGICLTFSLSLERRTVTRHADRGHRDGM